MPDPNQAKNSLCALIFILTFVFSTGSALGNILFSETITDSAHAEFTIQLQSWGRYSIIAKSSRGASIAIVDRKQGVMARNGTAGEHDGRIDIFLDEGEYKIFVMGVSGDSEEIEIVVKEFTFNDNSSSTLLIPQRLEKTELRDFNQTGWWFEIEEDNTPFTFEIQGRNLQEIALFRNGEWLTPTRSNDFLNNIQPEKPLRGKRITTTLNKGLYQIIAYGGPNDGYTQEDEKNPLFAQWGVESLGMRSKVNRTVGPSGLSRFLIPGNLRTVVLETPEITPLYLEGFSWNQNNPRYNRLARDSIHSQSSSPRTGINLSGSNSKIITVSGKPGTPFTLSTLGQQVTQILSDTANSYWISSLHTGNYRDQIGASGAVVRRNGELVAFQADTVSSQKPFSRRFNLLAPVSAYIWIDEAGTYSVEPGGVAMDWVIKRYYLNYPRSYVTPESQTGKSDVQLNPGLHVLEITPRQKGIATFSISDPNTDLVPGEYLIPRANIQFPNLPVSPNRTYHIVLNSQAPELSTTIAHRLPLTLDEPLSFYIRGGQKISVPIRLSEPKVIRVTDPNGVTFKEELLRSGEHEIRVSGPENTHLTIEKIDPSTHPKKTQPPQFSYSRLVTEEMLSLGSKTFFDMEQNSESVYLFDISEPGIYRLETVGRLHTTLKVRDRLKKFTTSNTGSGINRNALIVDYFLPGRYQVVVRTEGRSAGRTGLLLDKNDLHYGGILQPGDDKRIITSPFSSVFYDFSVSTTDNYRFESFNRSGSFVLRLEDDDGWPLLRYGHRAPALTRLKEGKYRLFSMPVPYETIRITRYEKIPEPVSFIGKGPHQISVNQRVSAVWVEDKKISDSAQSFVTYQFSTPAPIEASLSVTPGFIATLKSRQSDSVLLSYKYPTQVFLESGDYEIAIRPVRRSNHSEYQFAVTTNTLTAGLDYRFTGSRTFDVSVGQCGVYRFFSQGMHDYSATLLAADSLTKIAFNDNAYLDWNFNISQYLPSGNYLLRIENEESNTRSSRVFMQNVKDTLLAPVHLEQNGTVSLSVNLNGKQAVMPIQLPETGDILSILIRAGSNAACMIEMLDGSEWRIVGEQIGSHIVLTTPVNADGSYRLRLWSEDHIDERMEIVCKSRTAIAVTAQQAFSRIRGSITEDDDFTAWFKIDLSGEAPSHYRLRTARNTLCEVSSSLESNQILTSENEMFVSALEGYLWLETVFLRAGRYNFTLEPMKIKENQPLNMVFHDNTPRSFKFDHPDNSLVLITTDMDPQYPVGGILTNNSTSAFTRNGLNVKRTLHSEMSRCVIAALPGDSNRVVLWNAKNSSTIGGFNATITLQSKTLEDKGVLKNGLTSWSPQKPGAVRYEIDSLHAQLLQLRLPAGFGAVFEKTDRSRTVFPPREEILSLILEAQGGFLILFSDTANSTVTVQNFSTPQIETTDFLSLSGNESVKIGFRNTATEWIPIDSDQEAEHILYWSGSIESVDYLNSQGLITPDIKDGEILNVSGGGLLIDHMAGWGKIDLCNSGLERESLIGCRWGETLTPDNPVRINHTSRLHLKEGTNWFTISLSDSSHIRLTAPVPISAILLKEDTPFQLQEAWEGLDWDLPLEPGTYILGLKQLSGYSLNGIELRVAYDNLGFTSESEPYTSTLAPGESRLVQFEIDKSGKYGFGVAMTHETADIEISDKFGNIAGRGKQMFIQLEPGTYYLRMRVPELSKGTECTVYIFGQEPPPDQPPEDVIRRIIE
ncbi:hypothetical protein CHISP_0324 [Chitinispirillum alkaliphilum]|nr:hypothetical protein CHISP_0324 [Chitinispirillum alkaliphilum]